MGYKLITQWKRKIIMHMEMHEPNAEVSTTIVIFDQHNADKALTESASKPRNVS